MTATQRGVLWICKNSMNLGLAAPGGTYSLAGWCLLALGREGDFRHFVCLCFPVGHRGERKSPVSCQGSDVCDGKNYGAHACNPSNQEAEAG